MRDHGGDLDRAKAAFGGTDWIDLSTGINRMPYPVPPLPPDAWRTLPTASDVTALEVAAARAYGTQADVVALAGAQAAIQLVPRLRATGRAAVLSPSYNEHAAALTAQGWQVTQADGLDAMTGADLAVVVNPNNPDGRVWGADTLGELSSRVGLLVVDESFADPTPALSLAPRLHGLGERVVVLRSFGKFYGLAGVRLGFALGGPRTVAQVRALAGPWAVGGPAIAIGTAALADNDWQTAMAAQLAKDSARLQGLLQAAGWGIVGATALFVTVDTGDALAAQARLARAAIWTRVFPYSSGWLRLGLPGTPAEWDRLERALARQPE
ncbi:L-threonine O-3-phosphate decarboxylase [Loktanella fryxellensis]|uniref:threonine-phosphate decarboxylase n=1 Tax=Loktanella fryxellensis TaxID=245187 RepID=A0A1H8CB24_9RHOB|nr:threonine-phosphate decarboxylase CobD [Loktanella fryxellensis]SEM91468.1 L-threonine O-3-phosphate decarboxylase [Loktanella fryxellensis]